MKKNSLLLGLLVAVILVVGILSLWQGKISFLKKPADPVVQKIIDSGVLVVLTDPSCPPLEGKNDKGEIEGFDIDIAKEVAKELGVKLVVKEINFDKLIPSIANGNADLGISSITITSERSEIVKFSNPYLNAGQTIVVKKDREDIQTPQDLAGKRVAATAESTSEEAAIQYAGEKNVVTYPGNYDLVVNRVLSGELAGIVVDYPSATGMVENNPGLKIAMQPFTNEFYGLISSKEKAPLIEVVNEVIRKLKANNQLTNLENHWFH